MKKRDNFVYCIGPLLTELHFHKLRMFDSRNRYMNCILNKMHCVLFLCIQQMNGHEPLILGHRRSNVRDKAAMAGSDQCIRETPVYKI